MIRLTAIGDSEGVGNSCTETFRKRQGIGGGHPFGTCEQYDCRHSRRQRISTQIIPTLGPNVCKLTYFGLRIPRESNTVLRKTQLVHSSSSLT